MTNIFGLGCLVSSIALGQPNINTIEKLSHSQIVTYDLILLRVSRIKSIFIINGIRRRISHSRESAQIEEVVIAS